MGARTKGTTMTDLATRFTTASEAVKQLPEKPDNATMLRLYALYKQGSGGDVTGKRPGMMDFVGRAKYDAWAELEGKSQDEAMQTYVDLVEELKAGS
jgi:acyl-CoA-binding protein